LKESVGWASAHQLAWQTAKDGGLKPALRNFACIDIPAIARCFRIASYENKGFGFAQGGRRHFKKNAFLTLACSPGA
jgi:hypothetical protein